MRRPVGWLDPVMPRKLQRDLKYDLPGPLRPASVCLCLLEPFQFASDIDQHTGELEPYSLQRPHHPFLGGDDYGRGNLPIKAKREAHSFYRNCSGLFGPSAFGCAPAIGATVSTGTLV
jgi:hypothetical protein